MNKLLNILRDPISGEKLSFVDNVFRCENSDKTFEYKDGVINMLPGLEANYIEHYLTDSEYFDYFAQSEDKVNIDDERRLRTYIESKLQRDSKVFLDAGSGGVWAAKKYINQSDLFVSLDIGINNLKKAKALVPNPNHYCVAGDILNLPFANDSFDSIICSEVIEHVENPKMLIKSLYSALKPGGKLIITTPYKERLQYYVCVHCNKPTPRNAHIHSFDENKFKLFLKELNIKKFKYHIFGSKALIFSRSYIITKYFPFFLWKIIDRFAQIIIPKSAHILIEIKK